MEKKHKFSVWYVILGLGAARVRALFGQAKQKALGILNVRRDVLEKGARLLLEREKNDGGALKAFMNEASRDIGVESSWLCWLYDRVSHALRSQSRMVGFTYILLGVTTKSGSVGHQKDRQSEEYLRFPKGETLKTHKLRGF